MEERGVGDASEPRGGRWTTSWGSGPRMWGRGRGAVGRWVRCPGRWEVGGGKRLGSCQRWSGSGGATDDAGGVGWLLNVHGRTGAWARVTGAKNGRR